MLVVAMVITFMSPVMASSSVTTDKGLENAIKVVKSRIDIPADYKKFSYNVYNQEGSVIWNLSWGNDELQKYVYVTIDQDNFISSYSSYQYSSNYDKKIPKYSRSQGQEIAEKFIEKLNPKLLTEFKLIKNSNISEEREYYFNYVRQVNGIDYANNTISINVNIYTGQVNNFYCNYSNKIKFESADKIISLEQAKKNFIDKLGLKLIYNIKSDKDKVVSYLAYVPKDSSKYIDAVTGEVEKMTGGNVYYYSEGIYEKTADATAAAVVLTPDESKAVTDLSGLMTKEELDKKFKGISSLNIDSQFTLDSAELRKDWRDENSLTWYMRYTKVTNKETKQVREVSITADAKNGDILSFWSYYDVAADAKPQKTKEEAKKICDEILASLKPNHYSEVKYDDTYDVDGENKHYYFRYVRVKNGLECPSDYMTITYDNLTGNISGFSANWNKDLVFDDPSKAIPIEKAYEVLFDNNQIGFDIQYIYNYKYNNYVSQEKKVDDEAVLGYMIDGRKPCIISAETGKVLNYSGTPYKENIVSDYTDINGLKYENQVKILTQLSIRYFEDELKATEQLQQQDYFILLSRLNDFYYFDSSIDKATSVERMYNNLISSGIITKAEKAPTAVLTREEAAKYFVKFQRMSQVAEIKGIFKSDFKDADKISPNLLGYVCIASGLKAINSDKDYFKPKEKMTRLDGLLTIYNYLSNK